jgi:four helix bundle protein
MNFERSIEESAKSFKDLIVWQKAHELVLDVYRNTNSFPKEESYGLTSQFRRAVVSCAANISEGFPKKGKSDKLRFFNIAQGSLEECRYYCMLARDLKYISEIEFNELECKALEVLKILRIYMKKISESK